MAKRLGRKGYRALCANPVYEAVSRGLTLTWLSLSLVCFWADWAQLRELVALLEPGGIVVAFLAVLAAWTIALTLWDIGRKIALAPAWENRPLLLSRYVRTAWATALVVIASTAMMLMTNPPPDIVYKGF
jgi:hypothetical protein